MRHQGELRIIKLQLGARFKHLLAKVDKKAGSNFEACHKGKGPDGRPRLLCRDQAMMSVIAANDSGWRTAMSTVCIVRMSTEPAL